MVWKMMTFFSFLLATLLSTSVSASSHSHTAHKGLAKRIARDVDILDDLKLFTDTRWTFYDAGLGACGVTNEETDFIVALNPFQFGVGYPGPQCFKKITLEYDGKRTTATVVDLCPECPWGALDLSRGLFDFFAPEVEGVIYGQWYFGDDNGTPHHGRKKGKASSPSKHKSKPTSTHAHVHTPKATHLAAPEFVDKRPGVAHSSHAFPSKAGILKSTTLNPTLQDIPLNTEHDSDDEDSEHSDNLAALDTILGTDSADSDD